MEYSSRSKQWSFTVDLSSGSELWSLAVELSSGVQQSSFSPHCPALPGGDGKGFISLDRTVEGWKRRWRVQVCAALTGV